MHPVPHGQPQLLEGVELLKKGKCSAAHLADLKALGATMQVAAKCGLGQTSPSAFLSIVGAFADDVTTRPQRA